MPGQGNLSSGLSYLPFTKNLAGQAIVYLSLEEASHDCLTFLGALAADCIVVFPVTEQDCGQSWFVVNDTTGGFSVSCAGAFGGLTSAFGPGDSGWITWNVPLPGMQSASAASGAISVVVGDPPPTAPGITSSGRIFANVELTTPSAPLTTEITLQGIITVEPNSSTNIDVVGTGGFAHVQPVDARAFTNAIIGVLGQGLYCGAAPGSGNIARGAQFNGGMYDATGDLAEAQGIGVWAGAFGPAPSGNIQQCFGIRIYDAELTGTATIDNQYGIYVGPQTKGTTDNWGILTEAARAQFNAGLIGITPLTVKAALGQTAALVRVLDSTDNLITAIEADGGVWIKNDLNLAGGAAAVPNQAWTNLKSSDATDLIRLFSPTDQLLGQFQSTGKALFTRYDAGTNAVGTALVLGYNSTAAPAAGFGTGVGITLKTSTTVDRDAGSLTWEWATATEGAQKARVKLVSFDTAAREILRGEASGAAPMIGFLGGAAVVRQAGASAAGIAAITDANAKAAITALQAALAAYGLVTSPA